MSSIDYGVILSEEEVINRLTEVFGIHSIVVCDKVNTNKEDI